MYCPKCGYQNPDGARFCMQCRADLTAAQGVAESGEPEIRSGDAPPSGGPAKAGSKSKLVALGAAVLLVALLGSWWGYGNWSAGRRGSEAPAPTAVPQGEPVQANAGGGAPAAVPTAAKPTAEALASQPTPPPPAKPGGWIWYTTSSNGGSDDCSLVLLQRF